MFTRAGRAQAAKVCVIGKTVVDSSFPTRIRSARLIRISNVPCQIIGVLQSQGIVSHGTGPGRRRHHSLHQRHEAHQPANTLRGYDARAGRHAEAAMPSVQQEITTCSPAPPPQARTDDDFIVRNQQDIAEAATATARMMSVLLAGVAACRCSSAASAS